MICVIPTSQAGSHWMYCRRAIY